MERNFSIFVHMIIAFLALLLLHNFLAVPFLVRKKKPWAYTAVTLALLGGFVAYVLLARGGPGPGMPPPMPPEGGFPPPPGGPVGPGGPGGPEGKGPIRPEWFEMILGVLLLAANVGLIYWIQARRSTARIRELEAELKQRDEQPAPATPETMLFRSEGQDVRVEAAQIRYVEGMSEYIKIWRDGAAEPLIVLERLKNLEEKLPAGQFLRVHRSYIVNLARIRATAAGEITLDDGTHIPVGDSYRDKFRKMTIFGKTQ